MAIIWSGRTRGGVEAHLEMLHVTSTYAGLLEGVTNARMNQRRIADSVEAAKSVFSSFWPVYLVAPGFDTRVYPLDDAVHKREAQYDELPAFRCIGHFISFQTRDAENHASALTIVWFQNQSPVQGIELQVGELDWFDHAREFCY